jgi:hypothetical protein
MNATILFYLFGEGDILTLGAAFFWALVGVTISMLYESNLRDPNDARTPEKFSTWFLIKDNGIRILRTILVIISVLVFSQQVFGLTVNNWIGFGVGLGFDRILALVLSKIKKPKDEDKP